MSEQRGDNPLVQLILVRFREYLREPEALFWSFGFPILLAIGLGIAFRSKPPDVVHVAVVERRRALRRRSSRRCDATRGSPSRSCRATARASRCARGASRVVITPGANGGVEYEYDDTRPDARNGQAARRTTRCSAAADDRT